MDSGKRVSGKPNRYPRVLAHRFVLFAVWGRPSSEPTLSRACVRVCDNLRCVNPHQLYWALPADDGAHRPAIYEQVVQHARAHRVLATLDARHLRTLYKVNKWPSLYNPLSRRA